MYGTQLFQASLGLFAGTSFATVALSAVSPVMGVPSVCARVKSTVTMPFLMVAAVIFESA